jgi:eukaryotic-like serine/threonine-protein kinase
MRRGRYLVYDEIAHGGMATVHVGRLEATSFFARTVAVKRLHPQFARDPAFRAMLIDEARLTARIRHPNVASAIDVLAADDDNDGELWLVMDYVQGESLANLLANRGANEKPLDVHIAATILSGMLHGLHAAHEATSEAGTPLGIVHRDVSPRNVMVGVDGTARVLDFGIAKAVGRLATTRAGQLKGTLPYMAPEQLEGAVLTRRSDVYAAGVVAWEALTGERLFQRDDEAAVLAAVLRAEIVPPSHRRADLPPSLDAIVMRALARQPEKRFETARELALHLESCLGLAAPSEVGAWVERSARDELARRAATVARIERTPPPSAAPGSRRSMRRVGLAIAGAALLVTAVVGIAVAEKVRVFGARTAHAAGAPSLDVPSPGAGAIASGPSAPPSPPAPSSATDDVGSASALAPGRSPARSSPVRARGKCDPPYTVDEKGHKLYKPGCFH